MGLQAAFDGLFTKQANAEFEKHMHPQQTQLSLKANCLMIALAECDQTVYFQTQ